MCINEFYDCYFFIFFITKKLDGATLLIKPYSDLHNLFKLVSTPGI